MSGALLGACGAWFLVVPAVSCILSVRPRAARVLVVDPVAPFLAPRVVLSVSVPDLSFSLPVYCVECLLRPLGPSVSPSPSAVPADPRMGPDPPRLESVLLWGLFLAKRRGGVGGGGARMTDHRLLG